MGMKSKKGKSELSVIIITKNEEKNLPDCLRSVDWADEVIVVDTGSTDKTLEIAKDQAKVYELAGGSYQDWRNEGLKHAVTPWVLYVDADERVTPLLKKEIENVVANAEYDYYVIPRKNVILGKEMKWGGWWPDYVKRLYKRSALRGWTGELHEEPQVEGGFGYLKNPIVHLKHNKLSKMVEKTNIWSEKEAKLLFDANHPKMSWWRFIRIMMSELFLRLIKLQGFRDGTEGIIYAFYLSWSKFITYSKLWEIQINEKK